MIEHWHFCTKHRQTRLKPTDTKYGLRYSCPVEGCTVVLWDGSTSTPADYETRQARIEAHSWFDALWQSGIFTRKKAYKKLAAHLGLSPRKTHIGHFNKDQCQRTIDFCMDITGIGKAANEKLSTLSVSHES